MNNSTDYPIFLSKFQFHTGSIKSANCTPNALAITEMFQFHTGSIKSDGKEWHARVRMGSFNSILVRLKVSGTFHPPFIILSFNSILVRLKVDGFFNVIAKEISFNSILVRLKVVGGFMCRCCIVHVSIPYWFD